MSRRALARPSDVTDPCTATTTSLSFSMISPIRLENGFFFLGCYPPLPNSSSPFCKGLLLFVDQGKEKGKKKTIGERRELVRPEKPQTAQPCVITTLSMCVKSACEMSFYDFKNCGRARRRPQKVEWCSRSHGDP